MPDHLMGVAEIARLLNVSSQRVSQLAATDAFPDPIVRLAAGPIWEREDVEAWARTTGRM